MLTGAGLDDVGVVCSVADVNADGAAEDGAETLTVSHRGQTLLKYPSQY